jgi:hypothetical protein
MRVSLETHLRNIVLASLFMMDISTVAFARIKAIWLFSLQTSNERISSDAVIEDQDYLLKIAVTIT